MSKLAVVLMLLAGSAGADPLADHLRANGKPPLDYVLAKLDAYPIVILGEGHWNRADAELVRSVVPHLRERKVALAMEFFPAEHQAKLDQLVNGESWDELLANELMRLAEWPYVQYRDILEAAWKVNRVKSEAPPLRVLALTPPKDWREKKISYDGTMAARVIEYAGDKDIPKRLLVYCGMHHAFTKYQQVQRTIGGRATQFMDRAGNILWRQYGESVFLIALHKSEGCGEFPNEMSVQCAPFGGAIDCAARALGRPVGFDVLTSPVAELEFPQASFYARAHPHLRFMDYADGYIWNAAVDESAGVDVLPLPEYQTDAWKKHAEGLAQPLKRESMKKLPEWRKACKH